MTFLKRFGVILKSVIGIVVGFGPVVGATIPGNKDDVAIARVTDTLKEISNVVLIAEGMFVEVAGASGSQKLVAATPFVAQIIQRAEFMRGRDIMDEEKFAGAIRTITSGVADLLNSLKDKDIELEK